jgi:prepilin-type N-terminal cleavage/methylation domain-containing protein
MTTKTQSPNASKRKEAGFSLIEVLMATVLLGYAIASTDAFFMAASSKATLAEDPVTARILAREVHQMAKLLPREPGAFGVTAETGYADIKSLADLRSVTFSTAVLANGKQYPDMSGWSQVVTLAKVELDDLTTPKSVTPADDGRLVEHFDATLLRLTVEIYKNGEFVDSFSWLLRP